MHVFSPLSWFAFFPQAFRFWFVLLLIGWIAFPFIFSVFSKFKDKGFPLSKIFALFFIAYLNWLLTLLCSRYNLPVFQNNFLSLGTALIFLFFLGLYGYKKNGRRILLFIKEKRKTILLTEILFLVVFLFFVSVRSYVPEAQFDPSKSGAEKFFNYQVLSGIMKSETFPPYDGWMGGDAVHWKKDDFKSLEGHKVQTQPFYLNYYYFGHIEMGTLGKLACYPPEVVFNLGLAALIALIATGAFSLSCNLGGNVLLGLFGMLAVAFFGNLDALLQFTEKLSTGSHVNTAFRAIDYWRSSRLIPHTITEFPYFSLILGDFHAHSLNIPKTLFLLALLFQITLNKPVWAVDFERKINFQKRVKDNGLQFLLLGVFWGACYLTNAWDFFALASLIFLTIIFFYLNTSNSLTGKDQFKLSLYAVSSCILIALTALLTFSPFQIYFEFPIGEKGFPVKFLAPALRTSLWDYTVHFIFFLLPLLLYWTIKSRQIFWKEKVPSERLFFISVILAGIVLLYNWLGYWMPCLALVLFACCLFAVWKGQNRRRESFGLLLMSVGFLISFSCEVWHIDDAYAGNLERYNTLFKFYYSAWTLFAMAGIVAFGVLFSKARKTIFSYGLYFWLAVITIFGLEYPLAATMIRTSSFSLNPDGSLACNPVRSGRAGKSRAGSFPRTLNAIAYLGEHPKFKDDYEVIKFINENIRGRPLMLEAPPTSTTGAYSAVSRASTTTGLRTVIGWSHHEAQHRGGEAYNEISPRIMDVNRIFRTRDWNEAVMILDKYEVEYIFIGSLEREVFEANSLKKFEVNCKKIFSSANGKSALYRYR